MKTQIALTNFCRVCLALCVFALIVLPARADDDPPLRVARLNFMQGDVSFQPGGESDWDWATLNRPLTTGDSLWTGDTSRAEMHIGSTAIRVDADTFFSFLNLDDRTAQVQLSSGTIDVRVRHLYADDVVEVDTPNIAFTVVQQGDYRITVDPGGNFTTITLRGGQGQITGGGRAFLVDGNSQIQVAGTDYISYDIYDLPSRDTFDQWSYGRELGEDRSRSIRYVSPDLTGYEDLDQNGAWIVDRNFGPVWIPMHVSRDWAPYRNGHWAWIDPWGWTWVDDETFGFVTSHYGRWAYLTNTPDGGGWAWVPPHREEGQDPYAQRPVYAPALVTFVGDSNSSSDFGNGGGVAWFPLAPGEVYVPAYQTSSTYITSVNVTNTVVQQTTITLVVNNKSQAPAYANQRVAGAVTAVPKEAFVSAKPVAAAAVKIAPNAITVTPGVHSAPVAPTKESVMGANKPPNAGARSASAPPKPTAAAVSRAVVAKVAPPPPPVAFEKKQQSLQANPGKPLDPRAEQSLRVASPPPAARVVKTAPPATAVKPAQPEAKKPQPAVSLNKAPQVHAPAPAPPPPGGSQQQSAQQQGAEEKAKQQAAQQQASQQQSAQQQAAAEKAKQDAAQQQAAQQSAAEKAKQEAAQQQVAQQALAEKAKQEAVQQQASQQQAATEKAKQEAAQQQATQQAAADKAKQEAAQQQAAERERQQQMAQQRPQPNPAERPQGGPPASNQAAAANSGPVRVAENVQAAKLVSQPKLNYPPEAKAAHVQGTVRVQVLIGTDGSVKSASAVSGPPQLQAAALENVRQRRYQPTLLNGKPVEVETEVSVQFQ